MNFIGVDTSNYTTSVAVYSTDSSEIEMEKQLLPTADGALGLRQSDAVFAHVKQLGVVTERLFNRIGNLPIQAAGVSAFPRRENGSYMPCFLVGETSMQVYTAVNQIPLYRFSHQEGHIMAALYSANHMDWIHQPFLAFHVSGGTTDLLLVQPDENFFTIQHIAGSLDLKAGQAVDRVGLMLGLKFPCGPQLSALAAEWTEPIRIKPVLKGLDCCLSGIENKCAAFQKEGRPKAYIARYCLESIRAALAEMTVHAWKEFGRLPILYAGGVMASDIIRPQMEQDFGGVFAQPQYSSDNAAGIAILASILYQKGGTL
ncbi:MAG: peptidase M22 [Candidatus Merdivicinus sp.]|jgi:N6-L-threonylcarbamoyladenine synthase